MQTKMTDKIKVLGDRQKYLVGKLEQRLDAQCGNLYLNRFFQIGIV